MAFTDKADLTNEFREVIQNSLLKTLSTEPSALIGLKEELSPLLQDVLNKTRLGKKSDFDISKKEINDVIILVSNPVEFAGTFANNLQTELKDNEYAAVSVKVDYLKKDWGSWLSYYLDAPYLYNPHFIVSFTNPKNSKLELENLMLFFGADLILSRKKYYPRLLKESSIDLFRFIHDEAPDYDDPFVEGAGTALFGSSLYRRFYDNEFFIAGSSYGNTIQIAKLSVMFNIRLKQLHYSLYYSKRGTGEVEQIGKYLFDLISILNQQNG